LRKHNAFTQLLKQNKQNVKNHFQDTFKFLNIWGRITRPLFKYLNHLFVCLFVCFAAEKGNVNVSFKNEI